MRPVQGTWIVIVVVGTVLCYFKAILLLFRIAKALQRPCAICDRATVRIAWLLLALTGKTLGNASSTPLHIGQQWGLGLFQNSQV